MEVSRMAEELVCPRCQGRRCTRFGFSSGHRRWRCHECGRTWTETLGTPLFHLHTSLAEIVRSVMIVLHRGSLRAAEEQTGYDYETIALWIRRLGEHDAAVSEVLVHDLALSEVEIDEFWSFVGRKGGRKGPEGQKGALARRRGQPILPRPRPRSRLQPEESGGAV